MCSVKVTPRLRGLWLAVSMLAMAGMDGCGGGGGSPGISPFPAPAADSPSPSPSPSSPSGPLQPSANYAGQCVSPRPASVIDPATGESYGDRFGSAFTEKSWVRSWIDETYLWYDEVPATINGSDYVDAVSYFDVLKTPKITASGKPKDQFHFVYDTLVWTDLSNSGIAYGYGMQLAALAESPPRRFIVAYTDPNTPAALAGVTRGADVIAVDGIDLANGSDVATLNAGLFPTVAGQPHSFVLRDAGATTTHTVTLVSAQTVETPVQNVKTIASGAGTVGYLQFNDHIATSEAELIAAVQQLQATGPIADLVLDIRYNGGGLLDIASELAYMVAGSARTAGKIFDQVTYNAKNPFGQTLAQRSTPFWAITQGFSTTAGQALPSLGLGRVFVLTGAGTCSASEAIMNGLRGAGVQVIQIGETTCGKPYGFYPTDNCGTTYFAIQFQGVNNAGFGDYADGFVPNGSGTNGVPGCVVADDFNHALGDPAEARLQAALSYQVTGVCPASASSRESSQALHATPEPKLFRSALRENRFYRPR